LGDSNTPNCYATARQLGDIHRNPPARSPHIKSYGIAVPGASAVFFSATSKEESMAWTTPVLVEICIGLEINGYLPADGYVPPEF
jgi:coenzyme PQQ precursor peptide PqqA